jgi:lipoprotein-anchoring transpeptidase ErfK/SrfK
MNRKIVAAGIAAFMLLAGPVAAANAEIVSTKPAPALVKKKKQSIKAVDQVLTTGSITKAVSAPKKGPTIRTASVAQVKTCHSFIECIFAPRHRSPPASLQQASLGVYKSAGLSGKTSNRVVDWNETKYPVGSLIVRTPERALYYVSGKGEAIRYSVGVGRDGMQWSGNSRIVAKAEWPSWTPPKVMIEREAAKGHIIPPFMEGGPGNPLGARAMYIGGRMYRVHGTNNEASIGGAVSSGCIRMMNADVIDLYDRVKVGAKIYVYQ